MVALSEGRRPSFSKSNKTSEIENKLKSIQGTEEIQKELNSTYELLNLQFSKMDSANFDPEKIDVVKKMAATYSEKNISEMNKAYKDIFNSEPKNL